MKDVVMRILILRTLLCISLLGGLCAGPVVPSAVAEEPTSEATSPPHQIDYYYASATVERLADRLDKIIEKSELDSKQTGIFIADAESGQPLYTSNADKPMNPASNVKLLTSAAALDVYDPSYTFHTKLIASADETKDKESEMSPRRLSSTINGSLYVKGTGEAFLLFEDFISWAAQLRRRGVEKIDGDLVIDDTVFQGASLPPGYEQKNEDDAYRSSIGAVSVNFNAVTATVFPGNSAGADPGVMLFPPNDQIEVVNRAKTVPGDVRRIRGTASPSKNGTKLVVDGRLGAEANAVRTRKRINNPPHYAGSVLARALDMVGIELTGDVETGTAPEHGRVLIDHESQPLSYILLAMNKWSNNFMAEQLLLTIGAADKKPSTWERSRQRVYGFLENLGLNTSQITYYNGSGLYEGNLVSARQFVKLLIAMQDHRYFPEYLASLAISGRDGTLRDRLDGPKMVDRVRAKTGTLDRVSALSGYLRTETGRRLVFSMLFNNTPRKGWRYRSLQDKLLEQLVDLAPEASNQKAATNSKQTSD